MSDVSDPPRGLREIPARPQAYFDEDLIGPPPRMQSRGAADTLRPVSVRPTPAPVATTRVTQEAASDRRWMMVAAGLIVAFGVVGAVMNLNPSSAPRTNAGAVAPPPPMMAPPPTATALAPAPAPSARLLPPARQGVLPSASAAVTPSAHANANAFTLPPARPTATAFSPKPRRKPAAATEDATEAPPAPPPSKPSKPSKPEESDTKPPQPATKQKAMDTLEKAMSEQGL